MRLQGVPIRRVLVRNYVRPPEFVQGWLLRITKIELRRMIRHPSMTSPSASQKVTPLRRVPPPMEQSFRPTAIRWTRSMHCRSADRIPARSAQLAQLAIDRLVAEHKRP
jgi:hypothetical protein